MTHRHTEDIWLDIVETEFQMLELRPGTAERADLAVRLLQLEKEHKAAVTALITREFARATLS